MTRTGEMIGPAAPGEVLALRDGPRAARTVVVSSLASDAHTWNLVFLQLLIEECGFDVVNLGPCVPDDVLVAECRAARPAMIVISSVNGHGYQDGLRAIARLRACPELQQVPIVIGGKLGTAVEGRTEHARALFDAGFDKVFDDTGGAESIRGLVGALTAGVS